MKKILALLAAAVLIGAVAFALSNNRQAAPAFALKQLDGRTVSEKDFHGKVTLLNFWYPSCPGCVVEMPKLVALQKKLSATPYQTIAISLNYNSEAEVRTYVAQHQLPFIVAYDADNQVGTAYDVQLAPMSFLIDPQGKIVRRYIGEPDWAQLEQEIVRLNASLE
ncbi:MAG: TlpA disulfide reductase family protein [Neisseria sp.]|nr:TlpA disulfide reductase family protein [Neisseria sp.]